MPQLEQTLITSSLLYAQASGVVRATRQDMITGITVAKAVQAHPDFKSKEDAYIAVLSWLRQNGHGAFALPQNAGLYVFQFKTEALKRNPKSTTKEIVEYGVKRWMETCRSFAQSKGYKHMSAADADAAATAAGQS